MGGNSLIANMVRLNLDANGSDWEKVPASQASNDSLGG